MSDSIFSVIELLNISLQFLVLFTLFLFVLAGSSNGRTTPFGGVCRGSSPLPAARPVYNQKINL